MNPRQHYHRDGESFVPLDIWECAKCRQLFRAEENAAQCCIPRLCACGRETGSQFIGECFSCRSAKVEAARAAKAKRCPPEENVCNAWYDDPSDTYFYGRIEHVVTDCEIGCEPAILYFCHRHKIQLDAGRILGQVQEEANVGDVDWELDVPSLQTLLDEWLAENDEGIVWYTPDYSRCVETAPYIAAITLDEDGDE